MVAVRNALGRRPGASLSRGERAEGDLDRIAMVPLLAELRARTARACKTPSGILGMKVLILRRVNANLWPEQPRAAPGHGPFTLYGGSFLLSWME